MSSNRIDSLPTGVTDAGREHNYTAWAAGSHVSMCTVPWNSDYRDLVRFADQTALDRYIDDNTHSSWRLEQMTHLSQGAPIRIPIPFEAASWANYLRVFNPGSGHRTNADHDATYYYFITGIRRLNPSVTEISVQLDVWQTYFSRIKPGRGYVERGHVGIANRNGFHQFGRTHLTVPEGLDVGSEYVVEKQHVEHITDSRDDAKAHQVIVWSTVDLRIDTGDPFNQYGTVENPKLETADGTDFHGLPNGASAYLFPSVTAFRAYLNGAAQYPWITQGIISIMLAPNLRRYHRDITANTKLSMRHTPKQLITKVMDKWRDKMTNIPQRYRHLKKMLTFPYTVIELTADTGTPLILKPENWQSDDMKIVELPFMALPNPRLMFYPYKYNAGAAGEVKDGEHIIADGGEGIDMMTGIMNFPTFSVVNNGYLQYMASNAHSVAYSFESADWSQQKALSGNNVAYNQSTAAMGLANTQAGISQNQMSQTTGLQNNTAWAKTGVNAATALAGGARGGPLGLMGGAVSAATMGVGTAIDTNAANAQLGINSAALMASNRAQVGNMGYVRDTNKAYADYASRGDYANQIAGINAKLQDARLTQPSVAGQVGGEAFNLAMHQWGYQIRVKMLNAGAMRMVGDFWLRYGYAINRFMTPPDDFMVMEKFTYWKFQEFYIRSGAIPEHFRQSIRGIFEKGVTVWRNPDDIASVAIESNNPIVKDYYE